MQSGKLDEQVILQSPTEVNVSGSLSTTWAAVATVWAQILTARGSQAFESARVNARETIRIKMRWRDDVTTKWRVVWNGQAYDIHHVDRSMRSAGELWITALALGAL